MLKKKILFGLLSLFLILGFVNAISSGANEPIADNELGLTAKDCALQYCEEKDGMALWLTFVNECVDSPNPYFMEKNYNPTISTSSNIFDFGVSRIVAGSICSMFGVIGLIFGYVIGTNQKINQYIKISQIEDDDIQVEM